jgi:hypothetical protein
VGVSPDVAGEANRPQLGRDLLKGFQVARRQIESRVIAIRIGDLEMPAAADGRALQSAAGFANRQCAALQSQTETQLLGGPAEGADVPGVEAAGRVPLGQVADRIGGSLGGEFAGRDASAAGVRVRDRPQHLTDGQPVESQVDHQFCRRHQADGRRPAERRARGPTRPLLRHSGAQLLQPKDTRFVDRPRFHLLEFEVFQLRPRQFDRPVEPVRLQVLGIVHGDMRVHLEREPAGELERDRDVQPLNQFREVDVLEAEVNLDVVVYRSLRGRVRRRGGRDHGRLQPDQRNGEQPRQQIRPVRPGRVADVEPVAAALGEHLDLERRTAQEAFDGPLPFPGGLHLPVLDRHPQVGVARHGAGLDRHSPGGRQLVEGELRGRDVEAHVGGVSAKVETAGHRKVAADAAAAQTAEFDHAVHDFDLAAHVVRGEVDRDDFEVRTVRVERDAVMRRILGRVQPNCRIDRRVALGPDLFPRYHWDERDRPQLVGCDMDFVAMSQQRRVAVIPVALAAQGPMAPIGVVRDAFDVVGVRVGTDGAADSTNDRIGPALAVENDLRVFDPEYGQGHLAAFDLGQFRDEVVIAVESEGDGCVPQDDGAAGEFAAGELRQTQVRLDVGNGRPWRAAVRGPVFEKLKAGKRRAAQAD